MRDRRPSGSAWRMRHPGVAGNKPLTPAFRAGTTGRSMDRLYVPRRSRTARAVGRKQVTGMRKREHNLLLNTGSLLVCGLFAGIMVAALAFPAVAMSGLAAKAGAE